MTELSKEENCKTDEVGVNLYNLQIGIREIFLKLLLKSLNLAKQYATYRAMSAETNVEVFHKRVAVVQRSNSRKVHLTE